MECNLYGSIEHAVTAHTYHGHTPQLSAGLSVYDSRLVVTLLAVSEREEDVVAFHLPTKSLKPDTGI